tara:strand:- start:30 stop:236 length:207 start_codon:yes stop_codon:yes gene_type:complete
MTKEINYPQTTTWFICWSNDRQFLKAYGVVLPSQTMITYWDVLDTYTDEAAWIKDLKDNGIQKENNVD